MVSDQERINACTNLANEVNAIQRDVAHCHLEELEDRIRITSYGLLIMTPDTSTGNLKVMGSSRINPHPNSLRLYFFHEEDRKILDPAWENQLLDNQRRACYQPATHLVVLPLEEKETQRFQACQFIHELGHAYAAITTNRALSGKDWSPTERLIEEVMMMDFDYKLRLALGGRRFKNKIDRGADIIGRYWKTGMKDEVPSLKELGSVLSLCYGPPPPILETINNRQGALLVQCSFAAADKFLSPDKAIELKCSFAKQQRD